MANITMPKFILDFISLGVSAFQRGQKGYAVLIIKDDTDTNFTSVEYTSIDDLDNIEEAKYTAENIQYIKDCLEGTPKKLYVFRMDTTGTLADTLKLIKGKVPLNCWISIVDATQVETDELVSFVKSSNLNDKKRYKTFVYKATTSDNMHVVNFTNEKVTFKDERAEQTGDKAVSYLMGLLAGLSLDISVIAKVLEKFESVVEPDDLDAAIGNGEFALFNDEGEVKVARGVNSLQTTGSGITDDMKFIMIVESMDLTFSDVYKVWNDSYKGRYKNEADNQFLFFGAMNAYFSSLAMDKIMDPNYKNIANVNIAKQRLANIPKYGKEIVDSWDDDKVKEMTVGTDVFVGGKVKYLNAMEDIDLSILMA
ncbi:phage tail sheath C-terminal domain-containing protein [Tepidibacter mesophilus]|uniref:phage tail sheath C-terminal domain-containing protein n=1 Tax=Tepidibacter mesophilus TaxID=655607 RepID=UPI000C07B678|nr:phage tail sheath C-terminal domain-containing protein [Tepidibacter mesophilus]